MSIEKQPLDAEAQATIEGRRPKATIHDDRKEAQ